MAKTTGNSQAMLDALRAMGIEPNDTRKVIIELDFSGAVKVYVQQFGNDRAPEVVKTLGNADLRVEWGPAPTGGPINAGRLVLVGEDGPEPLLIPRETRNPSVSTRRTAPGETTVTIHRGDPKEKE